LVEVSNQKSQFGKFFEGLATVDVGMFYGHEVLRPFGIFVAIWWYIFSCFGMLFQKSRHGAMRLKIRVTILGDFSPTYCAIVFFGAKFLNY
jgi:hypothetical protein